MPQPDRATARHLAQQSLGKGDPIGWFDELYRQAQGQASAIPWADMRSNPNLAHWLNRTGATGSSRRALVVGCGLGDDAEALAGLGYRVTAFDVSATAIDWCRRRFVNSEIDYSVADLLQVPPAWHRAYDLVVEIYTLQVLPPEFRPSAMDQLASCLAAGGTLLVIARAREADDERGTMPWPLTAQELEYFNQCGLQTIAHDDFFDDEDPPVRRFRIEYRRHD